MRKNNSGSYFTLGSGWLCRDSRSLTEVALKYHTDIHEHGSWRRGLARAGQARPGGVYGTKARPLPLEVASHNQLSLSPCCCGCGAGASEASQALAASLALRSASRRLAASVGSLTLLTRPSFWKPRMKSHVTSSCRARSPCLALVVRFYLLTLLVVTHK